LKVEAGHFDDVVVRGNAEAVSILSSTLIDNAVKYTDRGGRIRVGVHGGSSAELRIEDSGPGIPANDRDRVFDRFYRRRDALGSGSGLGLAIAKEIATRCSSTIVLGSSEELGGLKASVFFAPVVVLATSGSPNGDFPDEAQHIEPGEAFIAWPPVSRIYK